MDVAIRPNKQRASENRAKSRGIDIGVTRCRCEAFMSKKRLGFQVG